MPAERARSDSPGPSSAAGGALLALLATLIWGTQFPVAKASFNWVDAYHGTLIRYAAPTLILCVWLVWREGFGAFRFNRRAGRATLLGAVGMCCSPALVFGGLMFTRPEVVAVVVATQPSMTALADWLIHRRRPPVITMACMALAFLGVVTVVTRWSLSLAPSGSELLGDLMVLAGSICWVVYTMGTQSFTGWSTLKLTTLTMVPGALANLSLVLVLLAMGLVESPTRAQWSSAGPYLAYLSLAGVLVSMLAWNTGTARIGALNAMLFLNLIPVVTFAVGFVQGHRPLPAELLGAAMVIAALVLNNLFLRWQFRRRAVAPI